MYTIRRGSTYFFQFRVPQPFVKPFGFTHFRVKLDNLSAREANRRAAMLAGGLTETLMSHHPEISNEVLLATCRWWLTKEPWSRVLALSVDSLVPALFHERRPTIARDLVERHAVTHFHEESGDWSDEVGIWDARRDEGEAALRAGGYEDPSTEDCLRAADTLEALIEERVRARDEVLFRDIDDDGGRITAKTLFSVEIKDVMKNRKDAMTARNSKSTYPRRLETAVSAFISLIGDKPLGHYVAIDAQVYVNGLAKIPRKFNGDKRFAGMSHVEAIARNAKLDHPLPTISKTTIDDYKSAFDGLWRRVILGLRDVVDITQMPITTPGARSAQDRLPFPPAALSTWLVSAGQKRLDHVRWLPLVGLLTGMRLAEIVYLQPSDFIYENGLPAISLLSDLIVDGETVDRDLKTHTSKRIVVAHKFLIECGFFAWARSQPGPWVFAGWHQHSADPSHEASKRMGVWLRDLGIHKEQVQVFHSLRHNTKAWLRRYVKDRTVDLFCGHALQGVANSYGAKSLEEYEARAVHEVPLPEGVDFSPFLTSTPPNTKPASASKRSVLQRKLVRRIRKVS